MYSHSQFSTINSASVIQVPRESMDVMLLSFYHRLNIFSFLLAAELVSLGFLLVKIKKNISTTMSSDKYFVFRDSDTILYHPYCVLNCICYSHECILELRLLYPFYFILLFLLFYSFFRFFPTIWHGFTIFLRYLSVPLSISFSFP